MPIVRWPLRKTSKQYPLVNACSKKDEIDREIVQAQNTAKLFSWLMIHSLPDVRYEKPETLKATASSNAGKRMPKLRAKIMKDLPGVWNQ